MLTQNVISPFMTIFWLGLEVPKILLTQDSALQISSIGHRVGVWVPLGQLERSGKDLLSITFKSPSRAKEGKSPQARLIALLFFDEEQVSHTKFVIIIIIIYSE